MKINRTGSVQNAKLSENNRLENYLGRLYKYTILTVLLLFMAVVLVTGATPPATELSGDEIFARALAQAELIVEGDLIVIFRKDNLYADGTTSTTLFAGLSQRVEAENGSLLLFIKEPEENFGMIHLLLQRAEEIRKWLHMPLLEMTKEIIVEEAIIGRGFEIGVQLAIEEYKAQLLGEEILQIAENERLVYLLALTARPQADVDFPNVKMWVDKETFLPLRVENYNVAGDLELMVEVLELVEFEGKFTAKQIIARELLAGNETTITIFERRRPAQPFPEQLFNPEKLASFDPALFGLIDQ